MSTPRERTGADLEIGPLGLRPRFVAAAERCTEIEAAMARYRSVGKEIPDEWERELEDMDRYARGRREEL